MPVLEIGLAAIGAAAATSYLVPLIISCGSAVIVAIGTFVAGFKLARRKNKTDLSELKKEQYARDKQTKQDAERIVTQTEQQVKGILQQSQKQQAQLDDTIVFFQQQLDASSETTLAFKEITRAIKDTTESGQDNLVHMYQELERLNSELTYVTGALKINEQALQEKEKLLKNTLDKLATSEKQASDDALISVQHIQKLRDDLSDIHVEFDIIRKTQPLQKQQIETLQQHNQQLTATIDKLENTLITLTESLDQTTTQNNRQFQEIQTLIHENKRLAKLVEELSLLIESPHTEAALEQTTSHHSMRLFS